MVTEEEIVEAEPEPVPGYYLIFKGSPQTAGARYWCHYTLFHHQPAHLRLKFQIAPFP
jgi:hypothetical protein